MSMATAVSERRIAGGTQQRPPLGIPEHPTCLSGRDLAFRLCDFMAAPAWTPADQVAFARSVVPLLSRWESAEADEYFARHLPGYARAFAAEGDEEPENPDREFDTAEAAGILQETWARS